MIGDRAIVNGGGGKSCREARPVNSMAHCMWLIQSMFQTYTYSSKCFEQTNFIEFSLNVALKESQADISLGLSLTEAMGYWPPSENTTTFAVTAY